MRRAGPPDPIYPLTLTELAFIIIFLVLLLTGWLVVQAEQERDAALGQRDAALAQLRGPGAEDTAAALAAREAALRQAEAELRALLAASGGADPDGLVSELVRKAAAEAENQRLRRRVDDLDAQLSALEAVRRVVEEAASEQSGGTAAADPAGRRAAAEALLSALEFQRQLAAASGETLARGREREQAGRFADAWRTLRGQAGDPGRLLRENRDLRARAAWLQGQLEARGGRDYPPCWAEEATGKPQYLFTIALLDSGLRVEPAWPPERAAEAEALPGVAALAGAGTLPAAVFRNRVAALDADSRGKNCRHYVRLANRVRNLAIFNRLRYAVEDFFYKFEIR